jgi:hypothetical protein
MTSPATFGGPVRSNAYARSEILGVPSWIAVWAFALLFTFESDLRSIGASERLAPISVGLVKGFWLGDLGLLVPLIALMFGGRTRRLFRDRPVRWVGLALATGTAVALARHNQFSPFAYDLRVCLALATGLALIECAPRRPRTLARALVAVSAIGVGLSFVVLLAMPPSAEVTIGGERVTAESAYLLMGPSIVLLAPSIVLASLTGDRRLARWAWMTGWALLLEVIVLLQTRSLAISILLALVLARMSIGALAGASDWMPGALRRRGGLGKGTVLLLILATVPVLLSRTAALLAFVDRMASGFRLTNDVTWLIRLAEVADVFASMGPVDHLIGLGLGPTPHVNYLGVPVFSLHVGLLNVWWRFGVLGLLLLLAGVARLALRWREVRGRLSKGGARAPRDVAMLVVAPGLLSLAAQATISGGWAITSMLGTGLAWGAYRMLADERVLATAEPTDSAVPPRPPDSSD